MFQLGETISLRDMFAQQDADALNQQKLAQNERALQAETATKDILGQLGAGALTMEDASNALMGVDPEMGLSLRREMRAVKQESFSNRQKAFDYMQENIDGVDSEDSLEAFKNNVRNRFGGVEGLDPDKILPASYEELKHTKGAWKGEAAAMTGYAAKVQQAEEALERWGPDDPRTVAAQFEAEQMERKYVDAAEKSDFEIKKLKKGLTESGEKFSYKERTKDLKDGYTQKEFSNEGGKPGTWQLLGEPKAPSGSQNKQYKATAPTDKQIERVESLLEMEESLQGVENADAMAAHIAAVANKKASESDAEYTTLVREAIDEVRKNNIKPGDDGIRYVPFDGNDPSFTLWEEYSSLEDLSGAIQRGEIDDETAMRIARSKFGLK